MGHARNENSADFFGPKGRYRLENLIDTGRSGTLVWKAWDTVEKELCAVKVIPRPIEKEYCLREILIHMSVSHKHVIQFKDFFDWGPRLCLVMEYAPNRTLLEYVASKQSIGEEEARRYCQQIVSALAYLHEHHIVLRDLKLENILLDSSGNVKICDFGFAKSEVISRSDSFLGTAEYFAPELVKRKDDVKCFWWKRKIEPYDGKKVDVWGFGVCLYTMLQGQTPFCIPNDESMLALINRIRVASDGKLRMPTKTKSGEELSPECLNLLRKTLTIDPENRPSIQQMLKDPWIKPKMKEDLEYDLNVEKSVKSAETKMIVEAVLVGGVEKNRELEKRSKKRLRLGGVSLSKRDVMKAVNRAAGIFSCFRCCF